MSVLHLWAFVGWVLLLALLPRQAPGRLARRILRFGIFNVILLATGTLFSSIWSCTIWGRLYYSTDYVFDFWPFWPITQGVIDATFGPDKGKLIGCTLFQLNLVWLCFAAATWALVIAINWWLGRFLRPEKLRLETAALFTGLALFPLSLLAAGTLWSFEVRAALIEIRGAPSPWAGFVPMLLQEWGKASLAGASGQFLKPPWIVYSIWMLFVACAVAIPWFVFRRINRDGKRAIQQSVHTVPQTAAT